MSVIKNNGRKVKFNKKKIEKSILAAWENTYENDIESGKIFATKIANEIESRQDDNLTTNDISNMVEKKLMASSHKDVAKTYIKYRYLKQMANKQYDELWAAIGEKLQAKNVKNQNANVDEKSFGGRIGEASSVVTKNYALNFIVSEMARNNHLNNRIYIHDLDAYSVGNHNCLSIPFDDLLANGFNTRQTDVRPAQSISTALQLVAVIFQLQSLQQFGGVSATHLDWTLVPYVRKSFYKHYIIAYIKTRPEFLDFNLEDMLFDDYSEIIDGGFVITRNKFDDWLDENTNKCLAELGLTKEDFCLDNRNKLDTALYQSALYDTILETKQSVEAMYHNLNTLQSRSGNQLPFTSINYGTCTSREGRIVIKSLLMGSIKGVGSLHRTSIFPCGIFQCMKNVNRHPGDPNYDLFKLALKSTAQRLYPNYANVDWSGNAGYDINDPKTFFSTMGCRTANGWDINGFGQMKDGRGNICPVTIIMPTLAMEAKEQAKLVASEEELMGSANIALIGNFLILLDNAINDAKDMLIERFDWICSQSAESASFMYENGLMAGYIPEEGIRSALKHGTLAIGQIGLAETLQILLGCDHTTPEGMELAKRIEGLFKQRCAEFKEKYKLNFGVYYTPAENLCHTSMKKFKETYGEIPNISDKEFFTNSMHVPVWKEMTPFEKIDIESELTGYSSAGCITYVELDAGIKNNLEALEQIVNYAMDKDIPYFAVNVPNDTCLECGYTDEFNNHCPICGSTHIQQLRRVTGYLTGNFTTAFNKGKIDEVHHRVKHK